MNNKIWKSQKPLAASLVLAAKAGCFTAMISAHSTTKEWADHLGHPCSSTHQSMSTLPHVRNYPTALGEQATVCYLFQLPGCAAWVLCEALPEFLIWPLFNFYWYKSLRTQVSNSNKYSRNAQDIKERLNKCRYIHVSGQGDTILKAQLKSINSGSRLPLTQPLCSRQVT